MHEQKVLKHTHSEVTPPKKCHIDWLSSLFVKKRQTVNNAHHMHATDSLCTCCCTLLVCWLAKFFIAWTKMLQPANNRIVIAQKTLAPWCCLFACIKWIDCENASFILAAAHGLLAKFCHCMTKNVVTLLTKFFSFSLWFDATVWHGIFHRGNLGTKLCFVSNGAMSQKFCLFCLFCLPWETKETKETKNFFVPKFQIPVFKRRTPQNYWSEVLLPWFTITTVTRLISSCGKAMHV